MEIGDPLLEKFYYGSNYVLASCSRGRIAPGLWGNWVTTNQPEWRGDYHLDYNHQAPWWAVFSSNHVGLAEPYDAPILDLLPLARRLGHFLQ